MKKHIIFFIVVIMAGCESFVSYQQIINPVTLLDNIEVNVEHSSGALYELKVHNNSDKQIQLLWDESTYVSTKGNASRLIRGQTRRIHSGQSQPAAPIPPKASLNEFFVPESFASTDYPVWVNPQPGNPSNPANIYFMFQIGDEKVTWHGQVKFVKLQ